MERAHKALVYMKRFILLFDLGVVLKFQFSFVIWYISFLQRNVQNSV